MSGIGVWAYPVPLERTDRDFQTILVPSNIVPFQKKSVLGQNDRD
jgi:hypothetical protein